MKFSETVETTDGLTSSKTSYTAFLEGNTGQDDSNLTLTTTTALTLDIIKDVLKVKGDFSYRAIRRWRERYRAPLTFYSAPEKPTYYVTQESSYKSRWTYDTDHLTANIVATWTPKLGQNHELNVVGGWNLEDYQYDRFYLQRKGMLFPEKYKSFELFDGTDIKVEQNDSSYGIVGFFGRANYTLLRRYIAEFSARYDGSSKFPSSQQWGFFPSASFGWRLSEEPFMKWSRSWLDNFKIRANWGYDIGIDADFLHSRLSFSGDIYRRNTTDMIVVGPELPALYGASSPKGNYGALKTDGWELTLSWRDQFNVAGKPLEYSIKGSLWDSRTWVTEYGSTTHTLWGYYEGKEIGEIWGFRTDGIFRDNEEANNWATDSFHKNGSNFRAYAGDLKFVDLDGDGDINYGKAIIEDSGDLTRIGNALPRFQPVWYQPGFQMEWHRPEHVLPGRG